MCQKILSKADVKNILTFYNIGALKRYKCPKREIATLRPYYILWTTKGKYFLKQCKLKILLLMDFLLKKGYPCVKLHNSKANKPYANYKGTAFGIFEFINPKHRWNLSNKEAYEMGKYLGRLHTLAKDFPIRETLSEDYAYFVKIFKENYYRKKYAPKRMLKVFEYIKNNIGNLKVPSDLPKSVCHLEFTPEHVRFRNQKIVKVIDFEAGRDFMFYDLGTTLVSAFSRGRLCFGLIANIIDGYDKERKLTAWERSHFFEAVQFGAFKFSIWGLEAIEQWGWHTFDRHIKELMKCDKTKFNEKLSKFKIFRAPS